MILFTTLILLVFYKFNLFQPKISLFHLYHHSIKRYGSDEKLSQNKYLIALFVIPTVLLIASLSLILILMPGILGALFTLVIWVSIAYLCMNHRGVSDKLDACMDAVNRDDMKAADKFRLEMGFNYEGVDIPKKYLGHHIGAAAIWINYRFVVSKLIALMIGGVLGPVILFLYSLTSIIQNDLQSKNISSSFVDKLMFVLDWIPARFISCTYLLTGHFNHGLVTWMKLALQPQQKAQKLLLMVAQSAIFSESDMKSESQKNIASGFIELAYRTSILTLILIAFLTIFGVIR